MVKSSNSVTACEDPVDSLIKGMCEAMSALETAEAEQKAPKPRQPSDYTELEKQIADMLTENTGCHLLDSGGAYGRHWQENRSIADFRKLSALAVTVWRDGQIEPSLNMFHFLTSMLQVDEETDRLNTMLARFARTGQEKDQPWLTVMEDFIQWLGWKRSGTVNTYNGDTLLSQVLQYLTFYRTEDEEWSPFVLLQIHNGCDVRGGYTAPRVFQIRDLEEWMMAMTDLTAGCKCISVHSDDCGYHWYCDSDSRFCKNYRLPGSWVPEPIKKGAESWEHRLVCRRCGGQVVFAANTG